MNDELKLEINLGNAAPNDLLNTLVQRGQVTHFVEKIPSMNDIFISKVSNEKIASESNFTESKD